MPENNNTKVKERKFIIECIQLYRELSSLWNVKSKEYHDRDKKKADYEILLSKYKEMFPEASKDDVKKKFNSLRTNYRKELKKHLQSMKSGSSTDDIYQPTLWYFNEMFFLQDQETASHSQSSIDTQSTIRSPGGEIEHSNWDRFSWSKPEKDTSKMTSTDTYQLKWHSHSSHLNGSVASLLRSERFTDVVLCTMDGCQIPAHKFILSSCSVYFSGLFEGQRSVTRMGGILYVVLPSEISTKALKILVEYMYKGETTVSNEVLDIVLKAGEVLKIRGLWRQTDEIGGDSTPAEKTTTSPSSAKQTEKTKEVSKIALKKDEKILKTFNPIQSQGGRPMFIGPPKLVFIKTSDGTTQAAIRPALPGTKGQTILVTPAPANTETTTSTITMPTPTISLALDDAEEGIPARMVKRNVVEKKYGKKQKMETLEEVKDDDAGSVSSKKSSQSNSAVEVHVKEEPEWDASSIEEEERSIAEMFQAEMSVKSEPCDDVEVEEEGLLYSPLSCELCAEVFSVPAAWVRHVQDHADQDDHHARKRKRRSDSDDTEETTALLRCDLCQKHFPNPAEWVRHIQSSHTETDGEQSKKCEQCNRNFPSHASMLIHLRTHTGERPFVCGLCNKGFNVKSNLLRHLRTLHDQVVSPTQLDEAGPSELKKET